MRSLFFAPLVVIACSSLRAQPAALAWQRHAARSHAVLTALNQLDAIALPPAPAGITNLSFAEFFGPIGDRGLEYSEKIRALDGHTVRLTGYMVREQVRAPGLFLLAGWPLTVETKGLCAVDTAPPTVVHVLLSSAQPVPYRPGRLVLTGRLEIGPRPEADGRNSTVRLVLAEP